MNQLIVCALNYYPVKSCAGTPLMRAELDSNGIKHDREFMVVDAVSGKFETQRKKPQMALVKPALSGNYIEFNAPGMTPLDVIVRKQGKTMDVFVRDIPCKGVDQGEEAARWFSNYLGGDYRLVRFSDECVRYAGGKPEQGYVAFADAYPLLVISEESRADLSLQVGYDIPMDRFRPNIVISGSKPYVEDSILNMRIGDVEFSFVKPCVRCNITLVDQTSAQLGKEPLATLTKYRRNADGKIEFGQNVVHKLNGPIAVGDSIKILDYKR
ncbi:MOSC N-terminal beta barrel domain-containing protein [Candidatus Woesearchaeota archaeon]|nr:MOSC N-terminal beta barrel domain-containing protein [Candidatus Woesearchaeota archaeon]